MSFNPNAFDQGAFDPTAFDFAAGGSSPPVFAGTIPDQELTVDVLMTPLDASAYFTGASSYSIAGTLPTGLSLDTGTGILSGTPTDVGTFASITITGTNGDGSDVSNSFTIFVADDTAFASGAGRKRDRRRRGLLVLIGGRG